MGRMKDLSSEECWFAEQIGAQQNYQGRSTPLRSGAAICVRSTCSFVFGRNLIVIFWTCVLASSVRVLSFLASTTP